MKHLLKVLFATVLYIFSFQGFAAVDISECEDGQGARSFHKICPPGTTKIGGKRISTGSSGKVENSNSEMDVTLYVIPDCEACDEVREFLQSRNITFVEKDANETAEVQKELTDIAGGLKVPTTVIGSEVIVGYERSQLKEILEDGNSEDTDSSDKK